MENTNQPCRFLRSDKIEYPDSISPHLEMVHNYSYSDHFERSLLVCKECGQLYFYEFYEYVSFISADKIYCTWVPVKNKEEADRINQLSGFEILKFFSLRFDDNGDTTKHPPEILFNKPRKDVFDRIGEHCSALDIEFETTNWPTKKVPSDKFPYLSTYQENNLEGYRKTINNLKKLDRDPYCDERDYWGQLESDLEHLYLS